MVDRSIDRLVFYSVSTNKGQFVIWSKNVKFDKWPSELSFSLTQKLRRNLGHQLTNKLCINYINNNLTEACFMSVAQSFKIAVPRWLWYQYDCCTVCNSSCVAAIHPNSHFLELTSIYLQCTNCFIAIAFSIANKYLAHWQLHQLVFYLSFIASYFYNVCDCGYDSFPALSYGNYSLTSAKELNIMGNALVILIIVM